MRGFRRSWWALDLALLLGVSVLLALLLLGALPTRLAFTPGEEPRGVRLGGFYGVEQNAAGAFRWARPTAEIVVPLDAPASYRVAITLADNPMAQPARAARVTMNGVYAREVALGTTPREYHFTYAAEPAAWEAGTGRTLRIELATVPWSAPGDSRSLGAIVTQVRVEPRPVVAPWQALALTSACLLVATTWISARRAGLPLVGAALLVAGMLTATGVWVQGGRWGLTTLFLQPLAQPFSYLTVLGFAALTAPTWALFRRDAATRRAGTIAARRAGDWLRASRYLLIAGSLGALTAFYRLGEKGLWGDEVWEALWSQQQGFAATVARFRAPPDLPLHFLLTRLATSFGDGEFWVRLPAALLGATGVLLLFLLGRATWGAPVGLIAAALLAFAPYHIWYAQEARPYAGLACYSTLSIACFVAILRRPTHPSLLAWFGLALATACNLLNHLFGVLPPIILSLAAGWWALAMLFRARRTRGERRARRMMAIRRGLLALASAAATAAVIALPVQEGITGYVRRGGTDPGSTPFRLTAPFLADLFGSLGFGTGWRLGLMAGLAIVGAAAGLRHTRPFALLTLAWLFLPLALLALTQPRHNFILRYLLFMQPVYLLLAARGLWQVAGWVALVIPQRRSVLPRRPRSAFAALLAVPLLAIGLLPTWQGYRVEKITDWSAACHYLHAEIAADALITGDGYFDGIMSWCFPGREPGFVARSDGKPLAEVAAARRTVWYLAIGPEDPARDVRFLGSGFAKVPRVAWARADLLSPLDGCSLDGPIAYPQSETPLTLYVSGHPQRERLVAPRSPMRACDNR